MIKPYILSIILISLNFAIDYDTEIQPIFDQHCISCHVGNFASGGLDLTNYENLMDGGNSGQVVIPGDHVNSILFQRIDNGDMPSGSDRLNQEDIDLISNWIDEGAGRCDEGFSYYPEAASEYSNITVQDGGTCFNDGDLEALTDIISQNDFEESMEAFELGTQTWNDGRLRFLVAGYYFGGVDTPIHTIPDSINQLNDLRKLYLEWNSITALPDTFTELTALVQLYISNNQLETLPENFGNLESLFILDLGYNEINNLPNSFINLSSVTYLWLFNNQLSELPENFCDLDLDWDGDDYFGYPYFAIGGNMLCEDIPECVANSDHLNTSLEQYYYSVQITVEQDCGLQECDDEIACNYGEETPCIYPEGTCDCDENPIDNYCDCDGNVEDCAGECGGDAEYDECGECGGDGPTDQCEDGTLVCDESECSSLEILDNMPSEYSLSQNYPNPFNPTTNISFSIVDAGQVSLKVYDISGKEIIDLVNAFYVPGTYNVKWNAIDSYGNQVSSGIYIYQLHTEKGIFSNSMILMR